MGKNQDKKPYFLWDYNLNSEDLNKMLVEGNDTEKKWLIGRILEHARFDDVFDYLNPAQIADYLPKLRLRDVTKQYWQRALSAWGYDV